MRGEIGFVLGDIKSDLLTSYLYILGNASDNNCVLLLSRLLSNLDQPGPIEIHSISILCLLCNSSSTDWYLILPIKWVRKDACIVGGSDFVLFEVFFLQELATYRMFIRVNVDRSVHKELYNADLADIVVKCGLHLSEVFFRGLTVDAESFLHKSECDLLLFLLLVNATKFIKVDKELVEVTSLSFKKNPDEVAICSRFGRGRVLLLFLFG